jgi:hypothetical protein
MSRKKTALIAGGFILLFGRIFQMQLDKNTERVENIKVVPEVDADSVSEMGYIFEVRDKINYSDQTRTVMWWVKVPYTDKRYSCSWEGGFRGFVENDGVRIIHKRGDPHEVNWDGYVIGLHGKKQGKAALVWALGLDDIETDQ